MNKIKFFWLSILNIQLLIAFFMIAASIFYTVTLLKLYITTPLLVIYEVFFYKKG